MKIKPLNLNKQELNFATCRQAYLGWPRTYNIIEQEDLLIIPIPLTGA